MEFKDLGLLCSGLLVWGSGLWAQYRDLNNLNNN